MVYMNSRLPACALLLTIGILAQERYNGPPPPKKDLPYLVQAGNLVETELGMAEPHDEKAAVVYVIPGPNSTAKTTLASPSFIIDASQIPPESLQLYRMESKDGHRQISFPKQARAPSPVPMIITRLGGSLFKLDPASDLQKGEYSLTPQGSNAVFCFAVD
jgi:hypothetical protein